MFPNSAEVQHDYSRGDLREIGHPVASPEFVATYFTEQAADCAILQLAHWSYRKPKKSLIPGRRIPHNREQSHPIPRHTYTIEPDQVAHMGSGNWRNRMAQAVQRHRRNDAS